MSSHTFQHKDAMLLTQSVSTILKLFMAERTRPTGQIDELKGQRLQQHLSIRTGIEGFADGMSIFPRLKEWENQIALQALRQGKTVQDLRGLTPFRHYLSAAKRATEAGRDDPFIPFANLFDASSSIDMLVSYGNFHTIRAWTWTLARQHPDLNLPLEQFYQTALSTIVPAQARSYEPNFGRSFTSYVVSMLKKRFNNFVNWHKREYTTPAGYAASTERRGRPKQSEQRLWFVSMDAPMPVDPAHTYLEHFDANNEASEDTVKQDDLTATRRIHLLSQLASLEPVQEETLIAFYVYGGNTTLLSQLRGCTPRSVRMHRQKAEEKIQALGYEVVSGVLSGRCETLEEARANLFVASENTQLDEVTRAS